MPLITQGKTNLKYVLVVGVIAIAASVVISTQGETIRDELSRLVTFSEIVRPTLKTYSNQELGFTIMYPEKWEPIESVGEGKVLFHGGGWDMTPEISRIKTNQSLEEWRKTIEPGIIEKEEHFTIDGEEAIRVYTTEMAVMQTAVRHEGYLYIIKDEGEITYSGPMATFRFLK